MLTLMEEKMIVIKEDYFTPEVILDSENGKISIRGRCTPIHANLFFLPLTQWAQRYATSPHNPTLVNIYVDFLNSSSKPYLGDFIKELAEVMYKGYKLEVTWFIENGDEDMQEIAQYLSETTHVMISVESGG